MGKNGQKSNTSLTKEEIERTSEHLKMFHPIKKEIHIKTRYLSTYPINKFKILKSTHFWGKFGESAQGGPGMDNFYFSPCLQDGNTVFFYLSPDSVPVGTSLPILIYRPSC